METRGTTLIYFSPTRTTKRVLEGIAHGVGAGVPDHLDLTPPAAQVESYCAREGELVVIGAPVYSGRIPDVAGERLGRLGTSGTPAVLVVVYGNRAYEDALLELKHLAVAAGFIPVAGGAFVGEHSFDCAVDNSLPPVAAGRPDVADLEEAMAFGLQIRDKMRGLRSLHDVPPLRVPGNMPYRERGARSPSAPVTRQELCNLCQDCAFVCPTGAITVKETAETDAELCIYCCACVKTCPNEARVWEAEWIHKVTRWLSDACRERRRPETFL
jgi:ferredoxin